MFDLKKIKWMASGYGFPNMYPTIEEMDAAPKRTRPLFFLNDMDGPTGINGFTIVVKSYPFDPESTEEDLARFLYENFDYVAFYEQKIREDGMIVVRMSAFKEGDWKW